MMNKRELNEWLLKWRGFTCNEGVWCYPDGVAMERHPPVFPESLDACLEWLVPKLTFWEIINYNGLWTRAYVWAGEESTEFGKYEAPEEIHPALALCLAIEKLIEGE